MNAQIRALQDALVTLINTSPIPMEAKRLILENLLIKVSQKSDSIIAEELKEKENTDGSDNQTS